MKTTLTSLLIAAMLCSINSTFAQTRIGANVGLAIPNGDNADGSGSGLGLNGRVLFPLSDNFLLGANAGYHNAATISFVPFTLAGEYLFCQGEGLRPYIGMDMGIYKVSYTVEETYYGYNWWYGLQPETRTYEVSNNKFGWAVHAGLYLSLSDHIDLNADVKYNTISASEHYELRYIDISAGLFFKIGSTTQSYKK